MAYKPHSVSQANLRSDHLSGTVIANSLVRPTRTSDGTSRPFALLGLAPGGVYLASDITAAAGGLLHRRFTLASWG